MINRETIGVSYDISAPINKRIAEINKIFFDDEIFDKEYNKYLLEQNRNGQKGTILNFIESILAEIQGIWDGAIGIENNYKQDGIEIKLHSVFNQLNDVRKNAEYRVNKIKQKADKDTVVITNEVLSFNSSYETKDLSEILYNIRLDQFLGIEKELLQRKFLNENCDWICLPIKLAVFIEVLYREKIFKKFTDKTEQAKRSFIRRFFEKRYNMAISDQFKPSNLTSKVYNSHCMAFTFINQQLD